MNMKKKLEKLWNDTAIVRFTAGSIYGELTGTLEQISENEFHVTCKNGRVRFNVSDVSVVYGRDIWLKDG